MMEEYRRRLNELCLSRNHQFQLLNGQVVLIDLDYPDDPMPVTDPVGAIARMEAATEEQRVYCVLGLTT